MTATMQDMIKAVRYHADLWYDRDGWDYVVETYSDEEIAEEIKGCRTEKGAIRKMKKAIAPLYSYRKDIAATGNW